MTSISDGSQLQQKMRLDIGLVQSKGRKAKRKPSKRRL